MEKFNVETDTLKAALPFGYKGAVDILIKVCLLYTSPSPRDS